MPPTLNTDSSHQADELDMTKPRATDLLKSHAGDRAAALRAFVVGAAVAA